MILRVIGLTFIAVLLLGLGYSQYLYVVNFTNVELPFLISRRQSELLTYNLTNLISGRDPRLYSMIFYALSVFGLVMLFIKLFFENTMFVRWTVYLYLATYLVGVLLFCLLALCSKTHEGLMIFQKIKNALSSPFILCFLVPVFVYSKKNNWS